MARGPAKLLPEQIFGGLPFDSDVDPDLLGPNGAPPLTVEDLNAAAASDDGGPRRLPAPMTPEDYQNAISQAAKAAEDYVDQELSPGRDEATDYYYGEPFGDEENGKSDVVMTEVRDSVLSMMPGLLRAFTGSTDPVEFSSNGGSDPELAEQQTQYISHILMVDNPGFNITHSVIKDALVRKLGIITWWHEEKEIVTEYEFSDLPPDAVLQLHSEVSNASDNSVNMQFDIQITDQYEGMFEGPDGQPASVQFVSGILTRRFIRKRFRIRALPPEEFILTPATSSTLEDFDLVGTRTVTTWSRLREDGFNPDLLDELMKKAGLDSGSSALATNQERVGRQEGITERIFDTNFGAASPASRQVIMRTLFVLIDKDGDGIAERRKIVTVGENNDILSDEIYGDDKILPFATFCPDPEPHTPVGLSIADQTMDLQKVKSQIVRRTLDSLDQSITNRIAVVEGQVNLDDALNNENGAIIRMKQAGAVQQLQTQFQGAAAMPVLAYIDQVRMRRTGETMGPSGLDADSLQSMTKSGVDATVEASNERLEMIGRIFAETGWSRLMRGMLAMVCEHQDYARVMRLRGKVVSVDPRAWNSDVDVSCNIGAGRGKQQQRIQSLMAVLAQQKEIWQTYGPGNPMVSLAHISYTLASLCKEMGFAKPSKFFSEVSQAEAVQIAQNLMSQPKKPTPEELLYQAQIGKIQSDQTIAAGKMQLDRFKTVLQDDRERDRDEQNFQVAAATAVAQWGATVNSAALEAEEAQHRMVDSDIKTLLSGGVPAQPTAMSGTPAPAPASAPAAPTPSPAAPSAPPVNGAPTP